MADEIQALLGREAQSMKAAGAPSAPSPQSEPPPGSRPQPPVASPTPREPGTAGVSPQILAGIQAAGIKVESLALDRATVGAGFPVVGARVNLRYRYPGLPEDNVFSFGLNYDFEKSGGSARASSVTFAPGGAPIWATGAIQSARSEHFLGLYRPGSSTLITILPEAELARSDIAQKLPWPQDDKELLLMARNDHEFDAIKSSDSGASTAAQAEAGFEVTPTAVKVGGRQMVVNVDKLRLEGSGAETLRHELGHMALAKGTRPFTPAWVSESAAMYVAGTKPLQTWRSGLANGAFDKISFSDLRGVSQLGGHDSGAASLQYAYAAAGAWYLVETFGPDAYWRLYRSFAAVPAAEIYRKAPAGTVLTAGVKEVGELSAVVTQRSLKDVFALTEDQLDAKVRQWIKAQTG